MSAQIRPVHRDMPMLLPPDLRDWVPEDDMVHFIIEAIARLQNPGLEVYIPVTSEDGNNLRRYDFRPPKERKPKAISNPNLPPGVLFRVEPATRRHATSQVLTSSPSARENSSVLSSTDC